jgi:hypothetical protein
MKRQIFFASIMFGSCVNVASAIAGPLPKRVGDCTKTTIKAIETRLVDGSTNQPIPGFGSAVRFANGGYQVSYGTLATIEHSKKGDPVRMCLVKIPGPCPKGDIRGRIYKTINLRTHKAWTLPDSQHSCGGA